jgi:hypothetical protein
MSISVPFKPMPSATPLSVEAAIHIAENFIAEHLGNLALAGVPRRMVFPMRAVWAVPIALAYPGYGLAGTIGVVAIDDEIAGVVAATPIDEMQAAAEQLYADQQPNIKAAFQKITSATD